jgi:hypothetical protein
LLDGVGAGRTDEDLHQGRLAEPLGEYLGNGDETMNVRLDLIGLVADGIGHLAPGVEVLADQVAVPAAELFERGGVGGGGEQLSAQLLRLGRRRRLAEQA